MCVCWWTFSSTAIHEKKKLRYFLCFQNSANPRNQPRLAFDSRKRRKVYKVERLPQIYRIHFSCRYRLHKQAINGQQRAFLFLLNNSCKRVGQKLISMCQGRTTIFIRCLNNGGYVWLNKIFGAPLATSVPPSPARASERFSFCRQAMVVLFFLLLQTETWAHDHNNCGGSNFNSVVEKLVWSKCQRRGSPHSVIGWPRRVSFQDVAQLIFLLSAVLHLGDIQFEEHGNNDAARISNCDVLSKGKKTSHTEPWCRGSTCCVRFFVAVRNLSTSVTKGEGCRANQRPKMLEIPFLSHRMEFTCGHFPWNCLWLFWYFHLCHPTPILGETKEVWTISSKLNFSGNYAASACHWSGRVPGVWSHSNPRRADQEGALCPAGCGVQGRIRQSCIRASLLLDCEQHQPADPAAGKQRTTHWDWHSWYLRFWKFSQEQLWAGMRTEVVVFASKSFE